MSRRAVVGSLALASASVFSTTAEATTLVARTRHGRVRGTTVDGVHVFKGVRYGQDTAPRRFQAPLAPRRWSGIEEATAYGAASPQSGDDEAQSEDCLFLNVWTPGLRDGGRRPVMFYIHGGAYNNGSGSAALYDGVKLCNQGDVVVITVNHRLNLFGYGYLARFGGDEFADSGNAGQLDLILALDWVRENAEEFGGDPNRIMAFGQSGGGAKIATLMAMPAAAGRFHRAATMSGQQVTASGVLNATRRMETYLAALGLSRESVQDIRTMPKARLIEAMRTVTDPVLGSGSLYFGPVLDERNLLRHPFYPDAAPQGLSIPMMIGNTRDETRGFVGSDRSVFNLTWEELPARLIPQMRIDVQPEAVVAWYRQHYPSMSPSDVYFAASTAARSWRAAVIEAEERAKANAPAFVYQVNYTSPREGGMFGAPHTIDIGLVFGNLGAQNSFTGVGPEAEAASRQMSEAFIAFARTGDPNCAAIPMWAPYTLPNRETMVFDVTSHMENDPRGDQREYFRRIPYIQPGT